MKFEIKITDDNGVPLEASFEITKDKIKEGVDLDFIQQITQEAISNIIKKLFTNLTFGEGFEYDSTK